MSIKRRGMNKPSHVADNIFPNAESAPVRNDLPPESENILPVQEDSVGSCVDEDFGALGTVWSDVVEKTKKELPIAVETENVDLSDMNIGVDEESFRSSEITAQIAPVMQEKVKEAVHQTVAMNNDRMKVSMTEVLDEYNSERLQELKKDRKKRQAKKRFWGIFRFVAVFVIIAILMTNAQVRARVDIIFQDTKKLVVDIFNDDSTSSNELVGNFFENLGTHLNEVNTIVVKEEN